MNDIPAVSVARERREATEQAGAVTLSTGIRARLVPVAAGLIDEVRARVKVPAVPMWHNPETDRDEENPNDPAYARALVEYDKRRGEVAFDAMVMFGVELVDPIPDIGRWGKRLKRLGIEVDAADPDEVEFAYKKYVALALQDIRRVSELTQVTGAAVEAAAASF